MNVLKKLESLCKENALTNQQEQSKAKACDASTQTGDLTPEADSTLDDMSIKITRVKSEAIFTSPSTSTAIYEISKTPNTKRTREDTTENFASTRKSLYIRKSNSSYAESDFVSKL